MASTFVLSGTGLPQHRHHGHGHGHVHSRSSSPSRAGSLNRSFKLDMSSPPTPPFDHDSDHGHDAHETDHGPSHSLSSQIEVHHHHHSHGPRVLSMSAGNKMQARQHVPPPVQTGIGFATTSTAAGRPLATLTNAALSDSPTAPKPKAHKHAHDHSAERSLFTNLILPYTARWPLLHTVMTEKDSRRIFYFMR